jgi:hypothetical protein
VRVVDALQYPSEDRSSTESAGHARRRRHYTEVLDFVLTWPQDTVDSPVVDLGHEQTEMQITTYESDQLFGSVYCGTPNLNVEQRTEPEPEPGSENVEP